MTTLLDSTTVKVDGTDLTTTGVQVTWEGSLFDAIEDVFDTISYPGLDESDTTAGFARPKTWTVRCRITGSDLDDAWSKIRAHRRRTKPGRKVQLTRYMPGGESDALVSLLAYGRRLGDTISWNDKNDGQAVVGTDFMLLGFWYPSSATTISNAAGTQTITGDEPTHKITATLSAAAASPVVTNSTNGFSFRYVGTVPSGGVTVDVATRRATKVSDSSDVSSALKWAKASPFQLDPGSNVITVSAGTCALSYYPAYQ